MPFQSKIIFGLMGMIIVGSVYLVGRQFLVPIWWAVSDSLGMEWGITDTHNESNMAEGKVSVSAGETVTIVGTEITLTNEAVAVKNLTRPFDALYIVTLQASRGNETTNLNLTRSQPSGYADQPTVVWNGYRFTLIKASPLGKQSAIIQVQPQS